jgi:PAS domain S-box-containing protein
MSPENIRMDVKDLLAVQQAIDVNIIMSVTNKAGIIIAVNQRFCEISQYEESELIGKSHNVVNSGYHPKIFFSMMWKTIAAGNTWHNEIKKKAKDGSFYWVDTVIVPVFDNNQKIHQYLSLRVLITDKKEADTALTNAAFTVSHKIRHPLVNMQALLTLCEHGNASKEDLKELSQLMQTELDKIDKLTRQMANDLYDYKMKLEFKSQSMQ